MSADVPTDPPAADGYLERATLLGELGRYDEAAAELGFALALDPAAVEVSTMLARVHLAAGRPAEALT
ncbi:tetratricopeptide repeat protein, partial [Verrucosispora sp. SN26_14.1]|uniref:tetratricopeptide repeat protein n=1 Tax=Verrucosispora sp. SN26_14.1 TaxID=2527879 RepID=UPI001034E475